MDLLLVLRSYFLTFISELKKDFMPEITINQAQVVVDEWIKKVGVRYFNE